MKYYAGIGSRSTPTEILQIMQEAASVFAQKGLVLRSGGADGADTAFEVGSKGYDNEIYLPWKNFNDNPSPLYIDNLPNCNEAREIAAKYHPSWEYLRETVKKLMARNAYQIVGKDLDTPVEFVLCYCPIKNGVWQGGTAQACRHAHDLGILIINLFLEKDKARILNEINR